MSVWLILVTSKVQGLRGFKTKRKNKKQKNMAFYFSVCVHMSVCMHLCMHVCILSFTSHIQDKYLTKPEVCRFASPGWPGCLSAFSVLGFYKRWPYFYFYFYVGSGDSTSGPHVGIARTLNYLSNLAWYLLPLPSPHSNEKNAFLGLGNSYQFVKRIRGLGLKLVRKENKGHNCSAMMVLQFR